MMTTSRQSTINRILTAAFVAVVSITPAAAQTVFQATGPDAASIQGTVDQFRTALGGVNNGNTPGPLATGRREINWDGGGSTATSIGSTPFDVFLNIRGGRFTTDGAGFLQSPPSGLGDFFGNPLYAAIFRSFSPVRLFAPIDSNLTEAQFFIPGTNAGTPATTRAFGVVFTDVDSGGQQSRFRPCNTCTLVEFFDADGNVLFSRPAPAAPGDGNLSFLGVIFNDARIARVRIRTGAAIAGPTEFDALDLVMMDDLIYAEPQAVQQ
jgi:hypothetical protein